MKVILIIDRLKSHSIMDTHNEVFDFLTENCDSYADSSKGSDVNQWRTFDITDEVYALVLMRWPSYSFAVE